MHALGKNLIIDSMTKEPDFIVSIRKNDMITLTLH